MMSEMSCVRGFCPSGLPVLEQNRRKARYKRQDTFKARAQSAKTATKVSEMVGNVNTSSALSAFDKMEEKGITFISSKRRKSRVEVTAIKEENDSYDAHQRSRDSCGSDGIMGVTH
ncbi:hypothetical protein ACFX2G_047828 [Malus domestica]